MSVTTIELLSRFEVFEDLTDLEVLNPDNPIVLAEDSPLNISAEKLEIALDISLVTEYDEELERLADYACLDDLLEIMQILKNGESPLKWAVKHGNRTFIELFGGTEIPYLAIKAKLFDWATELFDSTTDWNKICEYSCKAHWKTGVEKVIKIGPSNWDWMLVWSSQGSFQWGCEKAIEMGANRWDWMLLNSAYASFQWGCEYAIKMGANCWNWMFIRSTESSFQWGCEKAIEMGATDWKWMLYWSTKGSFQWGCEKAIEMGATDWDEMLYWSAVSSFQWGCEKAIEMGAKNWEEMLANSTNVKFQWGIEKAIVKLEMN